VGRSVTDPATMQFFYELGVFRWMRVRVKRGMHTAVTNDLKLSFGHSWEAAARIEVRILIPAGDG